MSALTSSIVLNVCQTRVLLSETSEKHMRCLTEFAPASVLLTSANAEQNCRILLTLQWMVIICHTGGVILAYSPILEEERRIVVYGKEEFEVE
jgi:hypothetical protein